MTIETLRCVETIAIKRAIERKRNTFFPTFRIQFKVNEMHRPFKAIAFELIGQTNNTLIGIRSI